MAQLISIARNELATAPHLAWKTFVEIAHLDAEDLVGIQRVAHWAFTYEGEVQNGGHLQFFLNVPAATVPQIRDALALVGALPHVAVLDEASNFWSKRDRGLIDSAQAHVDEARLEEFEACDLAFYTSDPSLTDLLELYFKRNQDVFVRVVD